MKLTPQDFRSVFRGVSDYLAQRIDNYDLRHRPLTPDERERALCDMVKAIHEHPLSVAGPHRQDDWEKGWGENLSTRHHTQVLTAKEIVRPYYYNKYPVVRWKGDLYAPLSPNYEYDMLCVIEDYIFDKYFRHYEHFHEFGCGTGHNLLRVRDANPKAILHGYDWAQSAVDLINSLPNLGPGRGIANIDARRFDFFHPDWNHRLKLPGSCGVYTVAALEQVGTNFHPWLNYIMEQRPGIVAHIEPIGEVLDPNVLQDYLSLAYFKKRGYLSGYLQHLRLLESRSLITIHEITRTTIGSKFIEGYTVIVWSPRATSSGYENQGVFKM